MLSEALLNLDCLYGTQIGFSALGYATGLWVVTI